MRKLFVTSCLVMYLTCPALADIAAGVSSTDCVESVLGSYTGPVSFSSVYRPAIGTITLDSNRYTDNNGNSVQSATSGSNPSTLYSLYGTGVYLTQPTSQTLGNYTTSNRVTALTSTPSMTGYSFQGFYTTKATGGDQLILANGNVVYDGISTLITSENPGTATLYAHWTPNTYNIAYNLNYTNAPSWTNDVTHPTSATYDTVFNVVNPERTGYIFNGWTISGMDTTTHYRGSANPPTTSFDTATVSTSDTYFKNLLSTSGTVTFTANAWTAKSYNISYGSGLHGSVPNNGTDPVVFSNGLTYDSTWTTKTFAETGIAADTGYSFSKWNTASDGSGTDYNANTAQSAWTTDGGLTLYAIYTANTHTVTYSCGVVPTGATTGTPGAAITGTPPTAASNPVYDSSYTLATTQGSCAGLNGYHFGGWKCGYNMSDGSVYSGTTANYASALVNDVWTVSASVAQYKVDANMTCTAIWVPNTINITFSAPNATGNWSGDSVGSCEYDGDITLPSPPERTGYRFNGWTVVATSS